MTTVIAKSPRKPKGSGHLRRSEILDAAQKIFAEQGYAGATVRKIAEQVGVSSTAIYLHFPDKRAMLMEIAVGVLEPMLAEARAIAAEIRLDARDRAIQMMVGYMQFAIDHPSSYAVLIDDAQRELTGAPAGDMMISYHRNFLGVIRELDDAGRLKGVEHHLVAQTIWAGCHGVIAVLESAPNLRWAPYADLRDTMIKALFDSLVD